MSTVRGPLCAWSAFLLLCAHATAQSPSPSREPWRISLHDEPLPDVPKDHASRWEFTLAPYLWMAGIEVDRTSIGGTETSGTVSFGDLLDPLEFGFMGHAEARQGDLAVFVDGMYTDLGDEVNDVEFDCRTGILEAGVAWRFFQHSFLRDRYAPALGLELLGGFRYWNLDVGLDPDDGPDVDFGTDWIDPIIGGRVRLDLTDRFGFTARADAGGFNVGSDFTWNVSLLLHWRVSRVIELGAGYRWLDVDYDEGTGPDRFEMEAQFRGPVLGVAIRF
jgi:hypothetical protein